MEDGFDFLKELMESRQWDILENNREEIESYLGMTLEDAKQLHRSQLNIVKKYPDAEEYDCWTNDMWDQHDFEERCPYCQAEMHLGIESGGPWDEFGLGTLGGDAIGQGKCSSHMDYEGDCSGYYTIYYKCPKCGKVFYIKYEY
mgnify:CR=1 FL=1